jgi:hypothetical protein
LRSREFFSAQQSQKHPMTLSQKLVEEEEEHADNEELASLGTPQHLQL